MHDDELKKAFGALAAQDARAAREFSRSAVEARRPAIVGRRRRRALITTGGLAVAIAAAVTFIVVPRDELLELDLSYQSWVPATDFLLNTPGSALLSTVPEIGIASVPITTPVQSRIDTSRRDQ